MTTPATMFSATLSNTVETARKPHRTIRRYRIGLVSLPVVLVATIGAGCAGMPRITSKSNPATLMYLNHLRHDLIAADWESGPQKFRDFPPSSRDNSHMYAGDWKDIVPTRHGTFRFAGPSTSAIFSLRGTPLSFTLAEPSWPIALIETTNLAMGHASDSGDRLVPTIEEQQMLDQRVALAIVDHGSSRREAKTVPSQGLIPISVVAARQDTP